ncbi:hypothetical protein CRE_21299 [Caenorhabditis remanei]|uniref:BTB domain-containing protein n=1 Tax=Caenorhabditis remanei TaxID=31234 RepID=E3MUK3_CAERE|nr:hypothetical protein CRE_21299 [Caenorhabditis remanei]
MSSPIQLDVGGTKFKTSKSTLTRFDGFFKTMLETSVPVELDPSGHIFIDRDPTHFQVILNYMRDDDVDLPDSEDAVKRISREANFYLLHGLMELCNQKLKNSAVKNLPMSRMKFLETYEQVLRIIANPQKPVILVYYSVSAYGFIKKPERANFTFFNISEFLDKYENKFDVYFSKLKAEVVIKSVALAVFD